MEITNNIDELYNLIESNSEHQTFIDNLELWTNFYNNREFIIENNILNPNLIEIIKFLLQHENGEISNEFANNIVSTIIRKQIQSIDKIQKDYNENKILTDTYQYYILLNFNNHNDLCSFINGLNKEIFSDNDIKDISISLETNTVISLTESLYNNDNGQGYNSGNWTSIKVREWLENIGCTTFYKAFEGDQVFEFTEDGIIKIEE